MTTDEDEGSWEPQKRIVGFRQRNSATSAPAPASPPLFLSPRGSSPLTTALAAKQELARRGVGGGGVSGQEGGVDPAGLVRTESGGGEEVESQVLLRSFSAPVCIPVTRQSAKRCVPGNEKCQWVDCLRTTMPASFERARARRAACRAAPGRARRGELTARLSPLPLGLIITPFLLTFGYRRVPYQLLHLKEGLY